MNEQTLEDELFSLRFENRTLSELLLYHKAERWVHGFISASVEKEHIDRYKFAFPYSDNRKVLDVACGCGYGSFLLATGGKAGSVTGVDLNSDSIRYGNHRYGHSNINRIHADATTLTYKEEYDLVCSFETVEHIPDYKKFISVLKQSLKPGGKLLISTPLVEQTNAKPDNPYHVIEWTYNDFRALLSAHFEIDSVLLQVVTWKEPWFHTTLPGKILKRLKVLRPGKTEPDTLVPYDEVTVARMHYGYQFFVCTPK